MKIFCIIPALNEEANIKKAVVAAKPFVSEVVVVDDGSCDQTIALAREVGATVLGHFINRGQGAALETGNQYALKKGADIIIHFDADNQFKAEEIPEVLAPIISGEVDAVFGSRFMGRENNMPTFKKKIIIPIAHLVNRFLFGLKVDLSDPQCGFRAMTKDAWKKISIEQDKMAHTSEILYKAYKNNLRIKEVPISVIYHGFGQGIFGGRSGGSGGIKVVIDMLLAKLIN